MKHLACILGLSAFFSQPAFAADLAPGSADSAWLLTATALVLFMTLPGLALFYGGLVRTKNVLSVVIQCVAVTAVVSLLWLAVGYSLTFGDGRDAQAWIGGMDKIFLNGVGPSAASGGVPEQLFFLFQMTFAVITPALVIGGFAERIRFGAVLIFAVLWLLAVYVPVAHWVWGGGWLAKRGVMDFAGGIVVHLTAGVSAMVAALMLGPRRGFPHMSMPPHNLPLTAAGAGMLWVGWFGFNGGSALAANGLASSAIVATHMGASAGALAWMLVEWLRYGKPSVLGILTGMVAGLGTITPASGFVSPMGAVCIGLIAGIVCFFATQWIKRGLHIDDTLDVSPVHGVGGVIGTLLTAVFAAPALGGLGFSSDTTIGGQFAAQALGVVSVGIWAAALTWVILKICALTVGLRVEDEHETEGLDLASHGERAYNE
ncbi:MAG TPA: ammonium transporter [Burkholderiales bacterium]|nr:ammonium transporter [Burkholderiales bacterium]